MTLFRKTAAVVAATAFLASTAAHAAPPVRASSSLPALTPTKSLKGNLRKSATVAEQSMFAGIPTAVAIIGGIAVVITTVVVAGSGDPASPG